MSLKNCVFLTLLIFTANKVSAQSHRLWAELESGPYAVGFKTNWEFDYTRTYNVVFNDGSSYATGKAPRPILINIWYPAEKQDRAQPMVYEEYLNIIPIGLGLKTLSRELVAHNREVICNELLGKAENELTQREQAVWKRFWETPTAAFNDAEPASGKFPLVVYHSGAGSSYEDNSVLCEYIASHGYVVVGSAYQDGDGTSLNTYGGETSVQDIAFLIAHTWQLPQVDWYKIALGGHSAGAQAIMRFRSKPHSVVDAIFLLDTTQDYHSLSNPLWEFTKPVMAHTNNFTGPMLIVAGPAAIFQLMDRLDHAERYYFTIDSVSHNELISQGVMRKHLASQHNLAQVDRDGKEISQTELKHRAKISARRFRVICQYILTFLNAHLKNEPAAIATLERRYRNTDLGSQPHVEYVPKGASLPEPYTQMSSVPPTPRQLRRFFDEHGADTTLAVLEQFWSEDTSYPIYDKTYGFVWIYELLEKGQTLAAARLFRQYERFYDDGLSGMFLLHCNIMERMHLKSFALSCFENLLIVDPENTEAQEKSKNLNEAERK